MMHELKHKNLLEKIDFLRTEAVAKHKEGNLEEAISFYLESIKLDKNQPAWIYGNVITLLAEVERFNEGLKLGEEAEKFYSQTKSDFEHARKAAMKSFEEGRDKILEKLKDDEEIEEEPVEEEDVKPKRRPRSKTKPKSA